jgi:hypothetical protein
VYGVKEPKSRGMINKIWRRGLKGLAGFREGLRVFIVGIQRVNQTERFEFEEMVLQVPRETTSKFLRIPEGDGLEM